ncbi:MAG: nucleotide exchange factor GrpE, partial [Bacteroides acidifaciens]|nr:nucleotide exchange factor GrpE [Bacteroides acidifaciens]
MNPKEKKVKEEEMNVEDILNNGAEEQPQNEQAEDAAPLTHEEELEQELGKAQETIEEQKDKYLRLSAEFDNYRKRTMKEK